MLKVKKLVAFLFILGVIALSLAACSNNANNNQQSESASTPESPAKSAEAASTAQTQGFPIVKEPLNLTYWVTLHPNVAATLKNYNEIVAYKETEKRTGIHIDFQHPATG
jgi:putative aldouronate transport system substrate-binding protein